MTILVINPNCLQPVTDSMSEALEGFRRKGGPEIRCETLKSGPPGIETQAHVDLAAVRLAEWVAEKPERRKLDALVVACFSDPGVAALREAVKCPVLGIGEASYLTAAALTERFGVIAILERSIPRHRRAQRALGVEHKVAGELALELAVSELQNESITWKRLAAVGTELCKAHGAGTVILGCAGMARYRARLEDKLGVAVIDPTQAAVAIALGLVLPNRDALVLQARDKAYERP
ncbi:MAG TPA: aspartate/glutamate racemase family protein [Burkholderiales bacterium]|jgi:Asp/Glu/hydantoin racemase|nr:aspartate/glutamate racemase family protein [Burkholderiales bacterium]